jgi:predicted acetyltransferase
MDRGEHIMAKLTLIKPNEDYIDEIRDYRQEWLNSLKEGEPFVGSSGLRRFENIPEWIAHCRDNDQLEQFMLIDEGERRILGMIHCRRVLSDYEAEYVGHIGYGVRPSERRKGYATAMLRLCLEKCRDVGLSSLLVLCEEHNEASRRTIVANCGKFERTVKTGDEVLERYSILILH